LNKTLYDKIIKSSNMINERNRNGYGNYMVVNSRVLYEIDRINTIKNRKRKLNSLK